MSPAVADRPRTLDEIIANVLSREALLNPRMRGMWAVLLGGVSALALLLVAAFFELAPPVSLDFLSPAGPPYLVLLAVALGLEGLLVVDRLIRHEEPPYPALTQAAAVTIAAVGVILVGVGAVLFIVWTAALSGYVPDWTFFAPAYYALLLVGSALLLAALPPFGASLIRPLVETPD